MEPITIFSLIDDSAPPKPFRSEIIFANGGGFICAPEKMNRNKKLNFIAHMFKVLGDAASNEKLIIEFRGTRGLSYESFKKAREYGLYIYDLNNKEHS